MQAVEHDNRGTGDLMFGFVYFDDGLRVAYATGHGVTNGSGGWLKVTAAHRKVATEYLDAVAPGWNNAKDPA